MITFDTYSKVSGNGLDWCCHCTERGKSRLVFFGATQVEAETKAREWINRNFATPERREILRQRAEQRQKTLQAKKAKEAA